MSGKPNDQERLMHIIESIDRISRFTKGMSNEEFLNDEVVQFAVIKNFEIIGEAAYHLSDELKDHFSEIEWKKIEAFRHVLVHDYYRINLEIIWRSKEEKIDSLKKQIQEVIRDKS